VSGIELVLAFLAGVFMGGALDRSKVGATTAQLVWVLGPRLPEPGSKAPTDVSASSDVC